MYPHYTALHTRVDVHSGTSSTGVTNKSPYTCIITQTYGIKCQMATVSHVTVLCYWFWCFSFSAHVLYVERFNNHIPIITHGTKFGKLKLVNC